jgi:hypothetical protein
VVLPVVVVVVVADPLVGPVAPPAPWVAPVASTSPQAAPAIIPAVTSPDESARRRRTPDDLAFALGAGVTGRYSISMR